MADFVAVAKANDLKPGENKAIEFNGREIALFNVDGEFYAIGNTCAHRGGPLGEGICDGNIVTCPWHGWKYDVTTGISPVNAQIKVASYEVKVEGDEVKIKLE